MGMEKIMNLEPTRLKQDIPGPRGLELMRLGMMFQQDALGVYDTIATYGDMVYCPWPNRKCIFLFHPDQIRHVLKDNQANYVKSAEYQHLKPLLGEGLLTSENEKWRQQRRLMAKEFHPASIDEYLPKIHEKTQVNLSDLKTDATFDAALLFSKITFQIAGDIFFGANVKDFSDDVAKALESETERINNRIRRAFNIPFSIPTPENCQGRKSIQKLDGVVESIMAKGKDDGHNVLQKLLHSKPELDHKTIRDEVMTLLLAGHETTSNMLTWVTFYLCQHPEWQHEIRNELKTFGKKARELTRADLAHLPKTRNVIKETLRLSPSIPLFSRMTIAPDTIGGYQVEAGMSVQISPWNTHRDERFWKEAKVWNPARFDGKEERKDDYTFIPFARGARSCIGEELAMVEGVLILAYLIEEYEWKLEKGFVPKAVQHLTLRSDNGLRVSVKRV